MVTGIFIGLEAFRNKPAALGFQDGVSVPLERLGAERAHFCTLNFVQYLLGSVIFGIILSLTLSSITYLLLQIFRKPKSS